MGADISTQKKCYIFFQSKPVSLTINMKFSYIRLRGATVARLTPDQKAACSNPVGVKIFFPQSLWYNGQHSCLPSS